MDPPGIPTGLEVLRNLTCPVDYISTPVAMCSSQTPGTIKYEPLHLDSVKSSKKNTPIMIMDELEKLKGQSVEVTYNNTVYRGLLAGASETEIYLQTSMDWVSLPMNGVTQVKKT